MLFFRTKVFSGNKSTIYSEVPKLVDFCVQIIKENLDGKYCVLLYVVTYFIISVDMY